MLEQFIEANEFLFVMEIIALIIGLTDLCNRFFFGKRK